MTSGNFSNPYKQSSSFTALAVAAVTLLFPCAVSAQSENYTPPPMFGDMTPPMVRPETTTGNIVEPKRSDRMEIAPAQAMHPPVVTPRASVDPNSAHAPTPAAPQGMPSHSETLEQYPPALPAPVVEAAPPSTPNYITPSAMQPKMMQPIIEDAQPRRTKPAEAKTQKTPALEESRTAAPTPRRKPSAPLASKAAEKPVLEEKTQPVGVSAAPPAIQTPIVPVPPAPAPAESAIRGPKTMPSVPASEVHAQETFQDAQTTANGPTIMERHQSQIEADASNKTPAPDHIVPRPNPDVTPARFAPNDQGVLKKTIPFEPGQISIDGAVLDPVAAGVVNELDGKEKADWRVQIRAFATPHGNGLSSDRRIALSRALSLRSSLIEKGVPASKIDVMAQGLEISPGEQAGDRIDLYLYGKKAE